MNIAATNSRVMITLLALAGLMAGSLWMSTARSEAAAANCGTFTVLHNDRIGKLSLPKGKYTVTVIDGALLTCAQATANFRNFLWDYDGKLPSPWRYKVLGTGQGRFYKQTNTKVAFTVIKQTAPDPTPGPTPGPGKFTRCPGTFQVLNNDRIGPLALPRGPYFIYVSTSGGPNCSTASSKFKQFLSLGKPRAPWTVKASSAVFSNRDTGAAFRVKQAK